MREMRPLTRQNHYVPEWYLKRFLLPHSKALFYLDLAPEPLQIGSGRSVTPKAIVQRSPSSCFCVHDLYTTRFGQLLNDDIEQFLFGAIDNDGAVAVRAFMSDDHRAMHRSFQRFFEYLGSQKLRTPKGLDWIQSQYSDLSQNELMDELRHLVHLNLTIWVEGVREIVSAEDSDVKFIVSDHPVTIYNAACAPDAPACVYPHDPSTSLVGTQVIFPLDANHCLILSHIEHVQDGSSHDHLARRTNARHLASTIARTDTTIRGRKLTRESVISINHVIKARARKYVAAAQEAWLYPEREFAGTWLQAGEILKPLPDQLFRIGGEIYIGYKDGSVAYQDAFGRKSRSHEYLRKIIREVGPGDECGCGSGRSYEACCIDVPVHERPSWSVYSIRERNILLFNAVSDILGLNSGKTWEDVRAELSDEQVARIHQTVGELWPRDTNLAELCPKPDARVFRAIYLGLSDPRTILSSVTSWTIYFDEIVLLNPFTNPAAVRDEYNPVKNPAQFKSQTLKNVMLLINLMPFIESGVIHLVPDPGDLDPMLARTMLEMAAQRAGDIELDEDDLALSERLGTDDIERQMARVPEDALVNMIRRKTPSLSTEMARRVAVQMKKNRRDDPFALLQPLKPGEENSELIALRGMTLELALLLAQQTGSAIYADTSVAWRQLQLHANADPVLTAWEPASESIGKIEFTLDAHPWRNHRLRSSGKFEEMRELFRMAWRVLSASPAACTSSELIAFAEGANAAARAAWMSAPPAPQNALKRRLQIFAPPGGYKLRSAHRLLVQYGHGSSMKNVPMALFVSDS